MWNIIILVYYQNYYKSVNIFSNNLINYKILITHYIPVKEHNCLINDICNYGYIRFNQII